MDVIQALLQILVFINYVAAGVAYGLGIVAGWIVVGTIIVAIVALIVVITAITLHYRQNLRARPRYHRRNSYPK